MSLLLVITSSLWASDVSQMKILGIGLGDKYEAIKNKLPCQNKQEDSSANFSVECKTKSEELEVRFGFKDDVLKVYRRIYFSQEPDWNVVIKDIFSKYGMPDIQRNNDSFNTYCWGACNSEATSDGNSNLQSFWVRIFHNSSDGKYLVKMVMDDNKMRNITEQQKQSIKEKEKQQASKIKF